MAVHLSIRRIPSIFLLALLALATAAGTAHFLSRSGPKAETASASQITAAVLSPAEPRLAVSSPSALEPRAAGPLPGSPAETATRHDPELTKWPERMPDAEAEPEAAAEPKVEVAAEPKTEAVVVAEAEAEVEAAPAPAAALAVPPAAAPAANAIQTASVPVAAPTVAPSVAPFADAQERITIARLAIEPQDSAAPPRHSVAPNISVESPNLAEPGSGPRGMAPIPVRAPRPANAETTARSATTLFQSGAEIRVKRDASVYITARNIPENDRLLEAYNADRPNGGRVRTRVGEATAAPGLLGIAAQAHRAQGGGQGNPAYSLADAMRDAIWRKTTAARLKSLTLSQSACADGVARKIPSIGLIASC